LPPVYDLVFVDGSHDRESVSRDAALARGVLKPGGLLAFHDYGNRDFGVTEAVDELLRGGAELLNVAGTVAVVRPATPLPVE
jgi:predicted O-methyltransferase YrrM